MRVIRCRDGTVRTGGIAQLRRLHKRNALSVKGKILLLTAEHPDFRAREIAAAVGTKTNYVYMVWRGRRRATLQRKRYRDRRHNGHGMTRSHCLTIAVDPFTNADLSREAKKRGLAKLSLLGLIVETIVDEGLFSAILD
jgi:hypothetical protein